MAAIRGISVLAYHHLVGSRNWVSSLCGDVQCIYRPSSLWPSWSRCSTSLAVWAIAGSKPGSFMLTVVNQPHENIHDDDRSRNERNESLEEWKKKNEADDQCSFEESGQKLALSHDVIRVRVIIPPADLKERDSLSQRNYHESSDTNETGVHIY